MNKLARILSRVLHNSDISLKTISHNRNVCQTTFVKRFDILGTMAEPGGSTAPGGAHGFACSASHTGKSRRADRKTPGNKDTLRHIRLREKVQIPYEPSEITLQVLGTGTREIGASVVIDSGAKRYLFNCGEGTQRLLTEHKFKMSKLENIFITNMKWENVGGLPGMNLTLKDVGLPSLSLFGDERLQGFVEATQGFSSIQGMDVTIIPYDKMPFSDEALTVDAIPIYRDGSASNGHNASPTQRRKRLKSDCSKSSPTIVYVCKVHDKPGSVIVEKAKKLGIKPGKEAGQIFNKAKRGESHTMPDGKIVKPEDLLGPPDIGPYFLVVDCPDENYMESLLSNVELKQAVLSKQFQLVVHMSPQHVTDREDYTTWMNSFGGKTEQLLLNGTNLKPCSTAVHRYQTQLNLVHPEIYPNLHLADSSHGDGPGSREGGAGGSVVDARCLLKRFLRPVTKGWDRSSLVSVNTENLVSEAMELPDFPEQLLKLRSELQDPNQDPARGAKNISSDYPQISFLGTGSCVPSKARNASGILLSFGVDSHMLLDCGEGTLSQLYRQRGPHTDRLVTHITHMFISHIHADHHLGIIQLIKDRRTAFDRLNMPRSPITIIAPDKIHTWLLNNNCDDVETDFRFIASKMFLKSAREGDESLSAAVREVETSLNIRNFETVYVPHCYQSMACCITHNTGWKISYSGDTQPSERFIEAGKDSTLLIHEATFEDDLVKEARDKSHSTTSEAIEVGLLMNARFTLLTHFSQRYAKLPVINDRFHDRVGIAFDHMRVRVKDLPTLPRLNPTLKALFADALLGLETKKLKRDFKKEALIEAAERARIVAAERARIVAADKAKSGGVS